MITRFLVLEVPPGGCRSLVFPVLTNDFRFFTGKKDLIRTLAIIKEGGS